MSLMKTLVLAVLLAVLPGDPPEIAVTSHAELVEVNHYFDTEGKPVFDQIIFYNWDSSAGRFNVVAWRLLKQPGQVPVRNPHSGRYTATWHDGRLLRTVHAERRIETWTQYDPETWERAFLSKSDRPDLVRPD
jgi:hypothetical protein